MKVHRTLPPAAAPLDWRDLWYGLIGSFFPDQAIDRFEEEIKTYFGVKYVFPVSSGKAALALILQGLQSLSLRKEVVIPAYTCFSVPSAVRKAGLRVTLCDIDPKSFDFNAECLEQAVTEKTLCVVPSHLFGIPSAMDEINRLARRKGAYVIEDAAQAMGGSDGGRKLGTIGDVGFFSLGRGKNITCGSGGLILTNSKPIAEGISACYADLETSGVVETWKEFLEVAIMILLIHPALYWFPAGLPFLKLGQTFYHEEFPIKKMSGMKAGLLRQWRTRLEASNRKRSAAGAEFGTRLSLQDSSMSAAPYLRFPVLVDDRETRDRLFAESQERGLGVSLMYPTPIHEINQIRDEFQPAAFPGAAEVVARLLTLPTHPLVSEKDKEAIIALFNETVPKGDRSSADRGKVPVGC